MPDGTIYLGVQQSTLAKNTSHRLSVQVNPSGASWISTFATIVIQRFSCIVLIITHHR